VFDHGDVESADGSGFNANSISVAYESVVYSNGSVGEGGQPIGFTDEETRYDNVMSPLSYGDPGFSSGFDALPKLFDRFLNKGMGSILPRTSNPDSRSNSILRNENGALGMIGAGLRDLFSVPQPGGLAGSRIPTISRRQPEDRSTLERRRGRILDVDTIRNTFEINAGAKRSFVTRSLNSNAIPGQTVSTYRASLVPAKTAIEDELVALVTNSSSIAVLAGTRLALYVDTVCPGIALLFNDLVTKLLFAPALISNVFLIVSTSNILPRLLSNVLLSSG
jgi:hypothetical protein